MPDAAASFPDWHADRLKSGCFSGSTAAHAMMLGKAGVLSYNQIG
jgi:hypothetical protein